jgi:hypothetical protein
LTGRTQIDTEASPADSFGATTRSINATYNNRKDTMLPQKILIAGLFLFSTVTVTATADKRPVKPVEALPDRVALINHFRALGYRAHGGVDKATADRVQAQGRSFPTLSSSFSIAGATYPFTMVGYPPRSGLSASINTVIIPLRMNFVFFGANSDVSHSFDPAPAVANIIGSPLYQPGRFPNGTGQFVDQMQRAAFWNQMDPNHNWHLRMDQPKVARTIDIEVTPQTGTLFADSSGNLFGDVLFDFLDSQAQTILQFLELGADTLPIFVTDNVTNQALGYHTAYTVQDGEEGTRIQTFIFTSWLDPALVPPIFADVSTFNHELAEWVNDPFGNNTVPLWNYPPPTDPQAICALNPFLEVGDPQGNGPTYTDFPAIVVPVGGVAYHLQQLVLWQWFTDQVPSSAFGGWYTFPDPTSLTVPAVYCQ